MPEPATPPIRWRASAISSRIRSSAGGDPLVYLCGHSLGLQPLAARQRINEELDDWAALGVRGHESARRAWIPYHELHDGRVWPRSPARSPAKSSP